MITNLKINKGHIHSGCEFTFNKGLTTITGDNGSGKSLLLDYIRFALFGAKALRETLKLVGKIDLELSLTVKESSYVITRSNLNAKISKDGLEVCTGTSMVNNYVRRLLGYGLEVFDVANCANQGELEKYSNMTPKERKVMIEKVMGLDIIDHILDTFSGQLKDLRKEETILADMLGAEPVAPEKPPEYRQSAEVQEELKSASLKSNRYSELKGWLSSLPNEIPVLPIETETRSISELQQIKSARDYAEHRYNALRNNIIPVSRVTDFSAEELERAQRFYLLPEKPPISLDDIEDKKLELDLIQRIRAAKNRVALLPEVVCPHCNEKFFLTQPSQEDLELSNQKEPVVGETFATLNAYERTWEVIANFGPMPEVLPERSIIVSELANIRQLNKNAEFELEIEGLKESLALPDVSNNINERIIFEGKKREYDRLCDLLKNKAEREAEMLTLVGYSEIIPVLSMELQNSLTYENQVLSYLRDVKLFTDSSAKLAEVSRKREGRELVTEGLLRVKARTKEFLIPNLQKAANALLSKVTSGVYSNLVIDSDFDISLGDKTLKMLCGWEKAVVNLSLRMALGQVLAHKQVPLFLGDEIDASMRDEKAGLVMDMLQSLKSSVGTMILVTHKELESDFTISLG